MHMLFRLLFRPIGIIVLGLGAIALGISFIFGDPADLPAKASLQQMQGVLQSATKITTKRRGSTTVNYELEVKAPSGVAEKFKLPEREISEQQVKDLISEPVAVLYSTSRDVWELVTGPRKVIEYDRTFAARKRSIEENIAAAPYIVVGGLLGMIAGAFWWWRRRIT